MAKADAVLGNNPRCVQRVATPSTSGGVDRHAADKKHTSTPKLGRDSLSPRYRNHALSGRPGLLQGQESCVAGIHPGPLTP